MKMLLQCHGCGFTECLDLGDGDFYTQEKELNRIIDNGWRFASAWTCFGRPVGEVGKVVSWWPLPDRR